LNQVISTILGLVEKNSIGNVKSEEIMLTPNGVINRETSLTDDLESDFTELMGACCSSLKE